jgi:hypothetical protein
MMLGSAQLGGDRVPGDLRGDDLLGGELTGGADGVEASHVAVTEPVVCRVPTAVVPAIGHVRCAWTRGNLDEQDAAGLAVGYG